MSLAWFKFLQRIKQDETKHEEKLSHTLFTFQVYSLVGCTVSVCELFRTMLDVFKAIPYCRNNKKNQNFNSALS